MWSNTAVISLAECYNVLSPFFFALLSVIRGLSVKSLDTSIFSLTHCSNQSKFGMKNYWPHMRIFGYKNWHKLQRL